MAATKGTDRMTAYGRGDYYERKCLEAFEAEGYHCWQARGSKGVADVIAVKFGQLVLIQVKGGTKTIAHDGWNGLLALCQLVGAVPVVADWPEWASHNRGPIRLRRITGPHKRYGQLWPAEPFVLDQVAAAPPAYVSEVRQR